VELLCILTYRCVASCITDELVETIYIGLFRNVPDSSRGVITVQLCGAESSFRRQRFLRVIILSATPHLSLLSQITPFHTLTSFIFRIHFNTIVLLTLRSPVWSLKVSPTNTCNVYLFSRIRDTCSVRLILRDLITRTINIW
jgi:hypothetical protein